MALKTEMIFPSLLSTLISCNCGDSKDMDMDMKVYFKREKSIIFPVFCLFVIDLNG